MRDKAKDTKPRTGTQKPEFKFSISRIADTFRNETFLFVSGAILTILAIFFIIAYISFLFTGGTDQSAVLSGVQEIENSTGKLGASMSEKIVNGWFGFSSLLIPVFLIVCGLNMMRITHFRVFRWFVACTFLMVWLSVFFQFILSPIMQSSFIVPGGSHGMNIMNIMHDYIGVPGVILSLLLTMLLFCIYLTRRTIQVIRDGADSLKRGMRRHEQPDAPAQDQADEPLEQQPQYDDEPIFEPATVSEPEHDETIADEEEQEMSPEAKQETIKKAVKQESEADEPTDIEMTITTGADEQKAEGKIQEPYDPRLDLSHYKFPTLDLLKHYDNDSPAIDKNEQEANKQRIIKVLLDFGIEIDTINATVGPTITLYEITPAAGVRISKIRNLEADIALSLAALGIRIIAPIPGKGTIGIEVPNAKPVMVSMESILNSRKFAETKMELPVALGRTITNEVFMFDLAKMPHLLVAGATGQGKSVGLNAVITSLLYKKHPAELKLVMVDPKMVEFSIYAPIVKHFLAKMPDETDAIITDTTKVIHTLKSLCIEMDNRYELLKNANVRSVIEYNNLFKDRKLNPEKGHRYLPYIVVVIDEFGDLIMTAGKDIEMPIARIAQKARAVGMHMIIATQRPTTNIITGTIKANFPARMAFRVSSMIDSRTILDRPGANQLIGRGDLLFLSGSDPVRVQCAFVDTPEVNAICQYISHQQGYTDAYPLPEYVDENEAGAMDGGMEMGKFDPMFAEAARLVVVNQSGSTSLIQRKFSIGYNRAGRLMDQLEATGIVGRADGSKPRPVLVTDEVQLDRILETYNLL
ncbi:MAG: DNA translocase FtsK 4TM domain-containing protein [Bacteroidaceae bacterium]|nr:DNA translocase FtsK 4TM domain-containing protein [Bacteroidaceae bacterium]